MTSRGGNTGRETEKEHRRVLPTGGGVLEDLTRARKPDVHLASNQKKRKELGGLV